MPSIPLTAQQIENNKKNAPQLPDHIKPYEEMGYDWEADKKIIERVGRDAAGNLLGGCTRCDKYYPFEEMSKDANRGPYGIKAKCKECENKRQRELQAYKLNGHNGAVPLQNNTITNPITEATTRLSCQAALEEKWNKANKDITLEGLRKMGLTDKHFIYIRRWFDIPDEIKKNTEIDFIIELQTQIGNVRYFCKAKNKKKINESDLSTALVQAQSKTLPLLFLTTGNISKKAKEKLNTDFKNIVYREI